MKKLAAEIRDRAEVLAQEYSLSGGVVPQEAREVLELVADCLEGKEDERLVSSLGARVAGWQAQGRQAGAVEQALSALEEALISLVHDLETATFLWQSLSRVRSAISWEKGIKDQGADEHARRRLAYLSAVAEAAAELTAQRQIDDLCRRAVELGQEKLEIDLVSIWLVEAGQNRLRGTFGVDETGQVRDERDARRTWDEDSMEGRALAGASQGEVQRRVLHDEQGQDIGPVWRGVIPLERQDGTILGILSTGDLVDSGLTWDDYAVEILKLYGQTIGYLLDGLMIQEALRESEELLLERRARQVETTTEVAQEIAAAPELEELYRRVVNLVKERFGYYHSQLFLLDREGEKLVTVAGYGEVGQQLRSQGHFVPVGQGVVGRAGQEGKALLSADVTQDPGWLYHPLLPETKGELAVPIMLRDEVLGVLDVQSDRAELLSDDDLLLLEGLCGQIAIAIESTRLRQEMEESLRELERIYRTMSREGWEAMQRDLGAKGYLFDRAQIVAAGDFWLPQMARAVETQAVVSDASAEGTTVVAPLATRGEIVGALGVHDAEEARLSPEEVALVEQVAEQVTQALESARLFDEEQRARSLLDMRVGELDCLNDIGRKIDEGPPVAELLSWVAGRVPAAMQYAQICRVAIEFEEQIYGTAEALALPRQMVQALRVGGRVSGKICIAYTQDRAFLDEESALLGDISRRIGGYVENRRLFRQTQARAEELTVLNELGQTLPACLSVDSVLDEAYRAASRLLDANNFYVTLYNTEADQVVFPLRIVGEEVERPYSVRPVGRGGLTEYLLDTRRSLLLRDNLPERMDALGIEAISLVPGRSALSWLGVPMMMGDRVLGTMVVLSYETPGAYDEHDRGLLTAVANQVAIALENVNLLEQARARAERERLVRTITDRVRRGMDRDAILRITLQEVGQMLGASKAVVRLGTQKDLLSDAGSTQKDNPEGG